MKRLVFVLWILVIGCENPSPKIRVMNPFPRNQKYFKGVISAYPQAKSLNDQKVWNFYTRWKKNYLRPVKGKKEYYIWKTDSLLSHTDTSCVSEGQGYGMLITVLMAGKDDSSREIFNGLFRYARSHSSDKSPYLMAWIQDSSLHNKDRSTATDGDMDIAYALLLADRQWGSHRSLNYFHEALRTIKAIKDQEINPQTYSVMLSNYSVNAGEDQTQDRFDMRSSDFMPLNLKAFARATRDPFWKKVVDRNYTLFRNLQEKWSPDAGLVPDFILRTDRGGRPAQAGYLEGKNDGKYYYNACRVPWRLGLDYIIHGDPRAYTFLRKINSWVRSTTLSKPDNISAGYSLGGEDIKDQEFEALSFICPFGVSAMIDSQNQNWLNQIWDYSNHFDIHEMDYYDNTLKMLSMIILSGNYFDY